MKLKYKLSLYNIITKLLLVLILWFAVPYVIKKVIYNDADRKLLEKKEKSVNNVDNKEINDFLSDQDANEVYGNYSTLRDEFIQIEIAPNQNSLHKNIFYNGKRSIEKVEYEYRILQHNFIYKNVYYQIEIGSSVKEIDDLITLLHYIIIITFLTITLFTFVIDLAYVSFLLKPFNKIVETKIKSINNPEKFNTNPIQTTSTDILDLDDALNQMMARIKDRFLKEKQFIGNVSHELLTPIAILKNRFENLILNQSLNNDVVDKISDSLNTLDSMKKVIANLLLISRIDNNQYKTDEIIDFNKIIPELITNLEDRILEKNLLVTQKIIHKTLFYGNKTLIKIMITNILTNAIKYNNLNGTISITDNVVDNQYTLIISDTGIGMSDDQVSQIFNRHIRLNFEQDGQGIGLAIVESIAHLHNIEIKVTSVKNSMTVFTLLFPKNKLLNKQ